METTQKPHLKALGDRGYVEGVTISSKTTGKPFCNNFGGIRYGLAPPERWRKAQKLPAGYQYGTKERPYKCPGGTGNCPQPTFLNKTPIPWDEDCFQCSIWVPVGTPPKDGWPVFFFVHGGWLQFGTPNMFSPAALLGETDFNAIIVMPAYRLNVFGFLYSSELESDAASVGETVGNHGFWDQRLALEWTRDNIGLFSGNGSEITIGGYSAGAHSVCYQLAYDLDLPQPASIIKRACIWSNSFTIQPKSSSTAQTQFNELVSALNIPASLPASEKLSTLRSTPAATLLSTIASLDLHEFRPTTDNAFIKTTLFELLTSGIFAQKLRQRGIRLLLGECADEHFIYGAWRPPAQDTAESVRRRLVADYPQPGAVETLMKRYFPGNKLPRDYKDWTSDGFGRVYADMQVHKMQRGFIYELTKGSGGGMDDLIYRYRIEYRLKCAAKSIPVEWGVTHATDQYIWFWGNGEVVREDEKGVIRRALIDPFTRFVHGVQDLGWGTKSYKEVRTLKADGSVEIENDRMWDEAVELWRDLLAGSRQDSASAKL
ncbi:uncharacterized protein APUU_60367A [Aspergillus puulaauensis]|uniref:Carboxylesterase type B domain-containing protein n=1 Tax=Aspergillus puulaauensis TaxID=1220207 RepID=A0A7R7XTP7_9EURO|nr:uncharacterized protein APUU_60367A [Aspergillus puulaauensis]BCS27319.1 hypothetical protein APUU_60367A [Aspergillus puulaauensis]